MHFIEALLLMLVVLMLFPLKLNLMKLLCEIFFIFLIVFFCARTFDVKTIILCLVILANHFFVKSAVANEDKDLLEDVGKVMAKIFYKVIFTGLLGVFIYYFSKETLVSSSNKFGDSVYGAVSIIVIVVVLMNITKKKISKNEI